MSRMAVLGTLGYVKDDISRESWLCQGWQFWVLLVMSRMTFRESWLCQGWQFWVLLVMSRMAVLDTLSYVRDGSFGYSYVMSRMTVLGSLGYVRDGSFRYS
jgi:hypothetical protein